MVRSKKSHQRVERAIVALLSEPSIKAAARSARVSEDDLRGWIVYPPFRTRYNHCRKALNAIRATMGLSDYPAIDELE